MANNFSVVATGAAVAGSIKNSRWYSIESDASFEKVINTFEKYGSFKFDRLKNKASSKKGMTEVEIERKGKKTLINFNGMGFKKKCYWLVSIAENGFGKETIKKPMSRGLKVFLITLLTLAVCFIPTIVIVTTK